MEALIKTHFSLSSAQVLTGPSVKNVPPSPKQRNVHYKEHEQH